MSLMSLESPAAQQHGADRHHQLHRPVLHAPLGERDFAVAPGLKESIAKRQPVTGIVNDEDEEEHRGDDVGDGFAARRELHIENVDAHMLVAL